MNSPPLPDNEVLRLKTLSDLRMLDSDTEERFDRWTRLAQNYFGVPTALISFIDTNRQWFKSKVNFEANETPRDIAFCAYTILQPKIMLIPDAREDERFKDNPLVTNPPNIRFYAGCPIEVKKDVRVGTLCLLDSNPRSFDDQTLDMLKDLTKMIEAELKYSSAVKTDEQTGLSNLEGYLCLSQYWMKFARRYNLKLNMYHLKIEHCPYLPALQSFTDRLLAGAKNLKLMSRISQNDFLLMVFEQPGFSHDMFLQLLHTTSHDCSIAFQLNHFEFKRVTLSVPQDILKLVG